MEYTQNYHLPQWVKSDRIMMEDFNDAMNAMENGMTASTQTANTALSTANTAEQNAEAARQDVRGWKNYKVGSYVGNRNTEQTINVGFRPSFVIVSGLRHDMGTSDMSYDRFFFMGVGRAVPTRIQLTDTGFTVFPYKSDGHYPDLNDQGRTYEYIAFR